MANNTYDFFISSKKTIPAEGWKPEYTLYSLNIERRWMDCGTLFTIMLEEPNHKTVKCLLESSYTRDAFYPTTSTDDIAYYRLNFGDSYCETDHLIRFYTGRNEEKIRADRMEKIIRAAQIVIKNPIYRSMIQKRADRVCYSNPNYFFKVNMNGNKMKIELVK